MPLSDDIESFWSVVRPVRLPPVVAGAIAGTYYGYDAVQDYLLGLESTTMLRELETQLFWMAPPMNTYG